MCSQFAHCVLVSQTQIHPIIGQPQNWRMYGTNMDLSRQMNWASLEVRFIWQVLPKVFLPLKIKRHIQECFIGQTSESLDEKIKFMSMFNDIERTKKGDTETCLHNAKEVAAIATPFMPGPCCFLALASENTWWNGNSNEPQRKRNTVAVQIVDLFQVSYFPLGHFQRQSHYRLDSWREEKAFTNSKVHSKTRRFSSRPCSQAIYDVFTIEFCHWYKLKTIYPPNSRRRRVDIDHAKTAKNATCSR